MRLHQLACAGLLAAALIGCSQSPARIKPAPLPELPAAPTEPARQWAVGNGVSAADDAGRLRPALADNRVLMAGAKGLIRAVDTSGATLWERKTGLPVSGGLSAGYGRLVFGTTEGDVVALSVQDGSELWRKRLPSAVLAPAALTAERVVVQAQDGRLHVLDAATGEPVWFYDLAMPLLSIRGYAMPVVTADRVIAASAVGKIVSLDLKTGAGQWESLVAAPTGRTEVERLVDIDGDMLLTFDDKLYVAGYQGRLAAFDLRGRPGSRWDVPVSTLKAPAEGLGNVYVADTAGEVLAVDAETGKPVWRTDVLRGRGLSAPVVVSGQLAVGDDQGYVHLLAQSDGRVVGRLKVRGAVTALLADGADLLVTTRKGGVSRWNIPAR